MAVIRFIKHALLESNSSHTEAEATYSIVNKNGEKYLQIDTYGSGNRKILGKKSQSIRFSPESLTILKEIIRENEL